MSDFGHVVSSLKEQMHGTLSRSDVLKPLAWYIALLAPTFIGAIAVAAHWSVVLLLGGLLALGAVIYLSAFIYCLKSNPDSLRSERYALDKMAIEHKLIGDNRAGTFAAGDCSLDAAATDLKQIENNS